MRRVYFAKARHLMVSLGMRVVLLVVVLGALAFVSRPGLGGDAIQSLDASPSPAAPSATTTIAATPALTETPAAGLSLRAIILAAFNRMPAKYRFEISGIFGHTDQASSRKAPLITIAGEVDGKSEHWVMKGTFLTDAGVDRDTGIESVTGGGKAYIKGEPLAEMDPRLWYVSDPGIPTADLLLPRALRSELELGQDELYAQIGNEVLDGQPCEVYRYDKPTKGADPLRFQMMYGGELKTYAAIDKVEFVFWVCQDGYLHKYQFEQQGHDPEDETSQGRALYEYHFWDMNSSTIAMATPSEAKPMPPTPTATRVPTETPEVTRRPATPAATRAPGQATPTLHPTPVSNWLFADDFVDNRNGWPIATAPEPGQSYFKDGAYYVVETGDFSYSAACRQCGVFVDFVYEATIEKVEGSDDAEFGIVFANSASNSYYFYFNGTGHWYVRKYTSDGWQTVKDWAPADAINKGNAKNKLRVVSSGPDFNFYINDRWVGQATDDTLPPGRIGVGIGRKGVLIRVEHVRVWSVGQ